MHPLCILWQLQIDKQNIETNPIFLQICACTLHTFVHAHSWAVPMSAAWAHDTQRLVTRQQQKHLLQPSQVRWLSHHDQQPSAETSLQPVFAVCILPFDTIPTSASVPTRVGLLGSFKQRAFRAWHASRDLRDAPYSTKSLAICCSRNKDTHQPSSWGLLSSRLSVGRYKGAQELLRVSGRPLEPHRQYLGSPTHCYWSQLGNQTTLSNKGPSSPRGPTWRPEVLLSSNTLCQPSSRVFVSHQVSWNCRKFQPADK